MKYNNYLSLPFEKQPWKVSSKASIASDFATLLRIKQGKKRKRCYPKSDFRLWQVTYFSTKNPINKLAVNKRRLLIAAEFHFVHPEENDSEKHHKLTQNCINFPHEFTGQILTNHSIKIRRRTWPTVCPTCNNWLNFRVRGQFEIKILTVRQKYTTYFIWIFKKKLNLSLRSFENS